MNGGTIESVKKKEKKRRKGRRVEGVTFLVYMYPLLIVSRSMTRCLCMFLIVYSSGPRTLSLCLATSGVHPHLRPKRSSASRGQD